MQSESECKMNIRYFVFFIYIILINEMSSAPIRVKRNKMQFLGDIVKKGAQKVWDLTGKFVVYVGIFTGGTIVVNEVTKQIDEWRGPVYVERAQLYCKSNNYGCAEKLCWASCGPRMRSSDWCFTGPSSNFSGKILFTKMVNNDTKTETSFSFVLCEKDADCDPCWGCAGSCMLGSDAVMQPDGTIENSN